jgi:hypothetical protein
MDYQAKAKFDGEGNGLDTLITYVSSELQSTRA